MTFPRRYLAALAKAGLTLEHSSVGGHDPLIERPSLIYLLADSECAHGHLPGDRAITCTCWPPRRTGHA